jgi:Rrf2 family protein
MVHLAKLPEGHVSLVRDVAAAQDVPESYMAKIFQDLSRSGLMISHRGARGGFSLGRSPEQITLRELIEALEGPIFLLPCLDPHRPCDRSPSCGLHQAMAAAQSTLLDQLEHTSLRALAASPA